MKKIVALSLLLVCSAFAQERPICETRTGLSSPSTREVSAAGRDGTFLVAWWSYQRGGQAMRIDAAGRPLTETAIGLPTGYPQAVFWNQNAWYVVSDRGYVRISADGVLLDPQLRPIAPSGAAIEGAAWTGSSLVFIGSSYTNLYAWVLDRDMNLVAKHTLANILPGVARPFMHVASDGASAVVLYWELSADRFSYPLMGAVLSPDGQIVRKKVVATDDEDFDIIAIGSPGDGRGYFVVTKPWVRTSAGFIAWQLDQELRRTRFVAFAPPTAGGSRAMPWDGTAYTFFYGSGGALHAMRLSETGTPLSDAIIARNSQTTPRIHAPMAAASIPSATLIVYSKNGDGISSFYLYARAMHEPSGFVTAEEIPLDHSAFQQQTPVAASAETQALVVWRERVTPADPLWIYATRVAKDGAVLDPQSIPIAFTSCEGSRPAVATNGRDFLVAWFENDRLRSAVVRADGTRSASTERVTSLQQCMTGAPAVASNGTDYLVVWSVPRKGPESYPTTWDMYAARVRADGTLVDTVPLEVGVSSVAASIAASNGQDYLVAFDKKVVRVSAGGTKIDRAGPLQLRAHPMAAWWNGTTYSVLDRQDGLTRISNSGAVSHVPLPVPALVGSPWAYRNAATCDASGCTLIGGSIIDGRHRFLLWRVDDNGVDAASSIDLGATIDPLLVVGQDPMPEVLPLRVGRGRLFAIYARRVSDVPFAGIHRIYLRAAEDVRVRAVRH